ncbi:MAG: enoyl-CoA hydratase-related protein [Bacteroidetes bacterium]|nr:enoyl-CoA hydratase-related protein [Bacteroidota bacterium]
MEKPILLEIRENIAIITLNRPSVFNSFNREMALLLQGILDECNANKNLRCIYITGKGKAFSAGQDIAELTQENPPTISQILVEHYNPIVTRIREIELPVVCAVNGVAAGAGANIALACDIVVATESASFIQAFSKIGLIPDSGGTFNLPRLIGFQKASALMMLGDKVIAKDACDMGMIYKWFADDVFAESSFRIAETIASMPTKGLIYTKQLLNKTFENNLYQQLNLEDEYQKQAGATKDYTEGINAFLEKRKPNFIGE